MKYEEGKLHFESHDLVCILKHKDLYHLGVLYSKSPTKGQIRFEVNADCISAGIAKDSVNQAIEAFRTQAVFLSTQVLRSVYDWDGHPFVAFARDWAESNEEPVLVFLRDGIRLSSEKLCPP